MLNTFARRIRRVPGKLKLNFLRFPVIKPITLLLYQRRLGAFAESTPRLSASAAEFLAEIDREGAVFTTLDELPFRPRLSLLDAVDTLLPELRANGGGQENSIRISHERIIKCPDIYLWGLDETLLDIAENCLSLPAFYHRVELRNDLVNEDTPTSASQWHRDPADRRIFKLIVYLNDVSAGGGPFEFISKDRSISACRALKYHSGYVSDAVLERTVPREHWQVCVGARGSVLVGDTAAIFHRIRAPATASRLSITFTYTSRRPLRIYDEVALPEQDIQVISASLTERQRRCLFLD